MFDGNDDPVRSRAKMIQVLSYDKYNTIPRALTKVVDPRDRIK